MIQKLRLNNIQSHEEGVLDFHDKINVIVGPSDNGKSAIMRGIIWLLTNRPSGNGIVSNWIKDDKDKIIGDSFVEMTINGNVITRKKTKDENSYYIGDKVLPTVGMDVPSEVKNLIKINEVNIQKQHDSHFLLNSSGAEVARFFNSIINLEQIDLALSAIDKKKKSNNKDLKDTKQQIDQFVSDLQQYYFLDKLKENIKELETKEKEISLVKVKMNELKELNIKYKEQRETIFDCRKYLEAENLLKEMEVLKTSVSKKKDTVFKLKDFIYRISDNKDVIKKCEPVEQASKYLSKAEIINEDVVKLRTKIRNLKDIRDRYFDSVDVLSVTKQISSISLDEISKINAKIIELKLKIKNIKMIKYDYEDAKNSIKSLETDIKDLKDRMPDVCPTCGQKIKIEEVI